MMLSEPSTLFARESDSVRSNAPGHSATRRGWMPRPNFVRLQLKGEIFLLTFPFIEPKGCRFESYLRSQYNQQNQWDTATMA
jgi:hypothetical protein